MFLPVSCAVTTAWLIRWDSRSRSGRKLQGTGVSRYHALPLVAVIATWPTICRSGVVHFGSLGSETVAPPVNSRMSHCPVRSSRRDRLRRGSFAGAGGGQYSEVNWVWLFWSDTRERVLMRAVPLPGRTVWHLSLIHISEPTRRTPISYAVFCLK